MRYNPWVDLQTALQRKIEPRWIFSLDDVMRQFASEPGAPSGDYRIVEKNKPNPARAYVIKRLAQEGQVTIRTAQRQVTEYGIQRRPPTAERMQLLQEGARRSFHRYQVAATVRTLRIQGTYVNLRANIVIESSDGSIDDRHRTVRDVYIAPMRVNPRIGRYWEDFVAEWLAGNLPEATAAWQEAYFEAMEISSGVGSIYDVEMLVMVTIATPKELQEAA